MQQQLPMQIKRLPFMIAFGVVGWWQLPTQAIAQPATEREFHGRWSVVGFGGIGSSRSMHGAIDATQTVGAGGVGLRDELARKFGMHVGVDVAQSRGTTTVYLQVGNAWFCP